MRATIDSLRLAHADVDGLIGVIRTFLIVGTTNRDLRMAQGHLAQALTNIRAAERLLAGELRRRDLAAGLPPGLPT